MDGHDVVIVTRIERRGDEIAQAGLRAIALRRLQRSSLNPLKELAAIAELIAIYRREQPDIVHQVAMKPVVYGTIAARLARVPRRVNALGGLGYVFSATSKRARLLRPILVALLRVLLNTQGSRLIVQSVDDYKLLTANCIVKADCVRLIRGAGVDVARYSAKPFAEGEPLILLASRMLWDKGVGEFVAAAEKLLRQGVAAKFVLVGQPDGENPATISRTQLRNWTESGAVEWWGHRDDMPEIFSRARIVCLPSYYGEGIPKVLIEAMACGRPIVTTDMPGCRDVVRGADNGLLVAPRDAHDLARAIASLVCDPDLCARMGQQGRNIAESEYALPRIIAETLAIYRELANE